MGSRGWLRDVAACPGARCGPVLFATLTGESAHMNYQSWAHGQTPVETYHVLVRALYALETLPVLIQFGPEVFYPLKGFLLLCLYGLLLCEFGIVVDGAGERCEARGNLAVERSIGGGALSKEVQIFPQRRRLAKRRIEESVLFAGLVDAACAECERQTILGGCMCCMWRVVIGKENGRGSGSGREARKAGYYVQSWQPGRRKLLGS